MAFTKTGKAKTESDTLGNMAAGVGSIGGAVYAVGTEITQDENGRY